MENVYNFGNKLLSAVILSMLQTSNLAPSSSKNHIWYGCNFIFHQLYWFKKWINNKLVIRKTY